MELGKTELSLRDILSLEAGDILQLDNRIEKLLKVSVGDSSKFVAKLGVYRNHKAVRIVDEIKEEDHNE